MIITLPQQIAYAPQVQHSPSVDINSTKPKDTNPFAWVFETPPTAPSTTNPQTAGQEWQKTTTAQPASGVNNISGDGSLRAQLAQNFNSFLVSAGNDHGYIYGRVRPESSKTMDCCTSTFHFSLNYLAEEDAEKLKAQQPWFYRHAEKQSEDKERWLRGAAGAIESAGLGTTTEITNGNLSTLKDEDLIGGIIQLPSHVAMISKVNRDASGKIISFETQNANTRKSKEGSHGLGTDSVNVDIAKTLTEGRIFVGQFSDDVLRRAGQKQGTQIASDLANRTSRTKTA